MTDFGKRLCEARKELGWSQQHVADQANLHRMAVAKIELGTRKVCLDEAFALAKIVGIPVDPEGHDYAAGVRDGVAISAEQLVRLLAASDGRASRMPVVARLAQPAAIAGVVGILAGRN